LLALGSVGARNPKHCINLFAAAKKGHAMDQIRSVHFEGVTFWSDGCQRRTFGTYRDLGIYRSGGVFNPLRDWGATIAIDTTAIDQSSKTI
jgi:hypothetical protein